MNQSIVSPATPQSTPPPVKNNARTKVALWLLIGPSALFFGVIVLYAITNLLLPEIGLLKTMMNTVMYLAGLICFLTWLPGIIIGIVLLATKGNHANN